MVGDAGDPRVDVCAAELLGGHLLAGRRLHERRPADEDRARSLDDDRLVAHRRHVGAAGGAGAHHGGDLRDALRRHPRLVEEDPAEVVAVREDVRLERQECTARVDEVDAGKAVLLGDLLRTQVLLDREREVRAALDGRVVGDEDALLPLDDADPGDDRRGRRVAVVQVPRCERGQLEEGGPGIDQTVDPLPRRQLAARAVALERLLAATARDLGGACAKLGDEPLHPRPAPLERLVAGRIGGEHSHGTSLRFYCEA